MNASRPTGSTTSVTQDELNLIGACLQKSLEQNPEHIFTRGQHYLVDVYEGAEARKNWEGETLKNRISDHSEHARVIYRMMSGVLQKQQKKLYPWTTFSFKPASVEGATGQHSFLNLQLVRSVSRKLWAMVRVHYPSDSRRPPELCCYVDRHIPALDVTIEPQIRIPLKTTVKLATEERSGVGLPAALFSDNTNLGKPLQSSPQFVDVMESPKGVNFTLSNASNEPVTVCEVVLLDFDDDEIDLDEVSLSGVTEGQIIKSGEAVTVTLKGSAENLDRADSVVVGYARGTSEDLDEDDDELMTEEELIIKLQGEDTRVCHISLIQGEAYDLLKKALLSPEYFLNGLGEDIASDRFISGDEVNELAPEEGASLMLNSADLDGGSIGTLTLNIESQRPVDHFVGMANENQEDEQDLNGAHFSFGERSAIPAGLTEKKSSKSKISKGKLGNVKIELIYLGKLALYNGLTTLDYGRARDFILNCVGAASLIRSLKKQQEVSQIDEQNSGLDDGSSFFL